MTIRGTARHVDHPARLSPAHQAKLDALVRLHGYGRTSIELGVGVTVVHRLYEGGQALVSTVARVAKALEDYEGAA